MTLPDKDAASTYGALSKVNYQNLPPADPTTDWDNTLLAPAVANIAGLTQTASRVDVTLTLDSRDGYIVINSWNAVWANATNTSPVAHHVSTGIYTLTWPTVVSDEYNASFGRYNNHTVNLTKGFGNLQNPGQLSSVHVSCNANVITFKLYDHTNALNDFVGYTVDIFAK